MKHFNPFSLSGTPASLRHLEEKSSYFSNSSGHVQTHDSQRNDAARVAQLTGTHNKETGLILDDFGKFASLHQHTL